MKKPTNIYHFHPFLKGKMFTVHVCIHTHTRAHTHAHKEAHNVKCKLVLGNNYSDQRLHGARSELTEVQPQEPDTSFPSGQWTLRDMKGCA